MVRRAFRTAALLVGLATPCALSDNGGVRHTGEVARR